MALVTIMCIYNVKGVLVMVNAMAHVTASLKLTMYVQSPYRLPQRLLRHRHQLHGLRTLMADLQIII